MFFFLKKKTSRSQNGIYLGFYLIDMWQGCKPESSFDFACGYSYRLLFTGKHGRIVGM